jgi:transposase-like protein
LPESDINLVSLIEEFGSDERCRSYLEHIRWPDGIRCPRCGSDKISRIKDRGQFDCDTCRYQFSVTAGTIFHDSHLPIWKWFLATYIICESKKGVSANQLKRMLNVSYKTSWYLCHRIRAAMKEAAPEMLTGTVEVDETWVGGKTRGMGHGYKGNKTMVLGALQRGGQVRFKIEQQRTRLVLHTFVYDHVADECVAIYTDEWPAYGNMSDENTVHETVNHRAEEWVRGDVHTNGVEGVWSLFKRSIIGSYHHLSHKHLEAYLDEMAFRFNNRHNRFLFRDTLLRLIDADILPYRTLVSSAELLSSAGSS